jgi:cell division protein FtsB
MESLHNDSGKFTKSEIVFVLLLALFVGAFTYVVICHDKTKDEKLKQRVEQMNAHIKYLHDEEGYSWEAARKIGATEAGFIPVDADYTSLKED